ncbi:NAD/FAD-utilizing enzyme [Aquisalimonas sp.]|uniref:NAD/FAD-utilizing enzyme n=1 Tax=Aquisalimonas sp. TaxID=1872621 RepID=UPI0025BB9F4A|nr:NAD/FAD-utilizing enzyme [Aquisalimonas sp.]
MKTTRYFFISDDLDDLERLEEELEQEGIVTPQIHVLTNNESGVKHHHHLHAVTDLMKRDVVHSSLIGAAVGACLAIVVLVVAALTGWTDTPAGWVPFIFLAIVLLGFFTWEGGLRGIETPNVQFERFERALKDKKHVFFVDLEPGQEEIVERAVKRHPSLQRAGTGGGAPHWIITFQYRVKRFFTQTFP